MVMVILLAMELFIVVYAGSVCFKRSKELK